MPHRGRELQQRYPRAGEIELADLGGDWLAVGRRCCRSVIRITSRDATHIHASEFFLQRRPLAGIWVLGRMGSGEAAKGIRRPALRGQGGPEDQIGPDARGQRERGEWGSRVRLDRPQKTPGSELIQREPDQTSVNTLTQPAAGGDRLRSYPSPRGTPWFAAAPWSSRVESPDGDAQNAARAGAVDAEVGVFTAAQFLRPTPGSRYAAFSAL